MWCLKRFYEGLKGSHLVVINTKIIDYESSLFSLLQLNVIIVFNTRVSFEPMTSQTSSVIRQKGESQNGCFKNTKQAKFSEKRTFLTPLIRTLRIRGLEMFVFRKIWLPLCSWNTCFEIRPFALLPTTSGLVFEMAKRF